MIGLVNEAYLRYSPTPLLRQLGKKFGYPLPTFLKQGFLNSHGLSSKGTCGYWLYGLRGIDSPSLASSIESISCILPTPRRRQFGWEWLSGIDFSATVGRREKCRGMPGQPSSRNSIHAVVDLQGHRGWERLQECVLSRSAIDLDLAARRAALQQPATVTARRIYSAAFRYFSTSTAHCSNRIATCNGATANISYEMLF